MQKNALPADAVKRKAGGGICGRGVECFTLAWTAGLLSAFLDMRFPAAIALTVIIILMLCCGSRRTLTGCLLIVCGFGMGCGAWLRYDTNVKQPLCALDGQTQTLDGTVSDWTVLTGDRMVYTLRTALAGRSHSVDWYADAKTPRLEIGDHVTLDAELTRIQPDYRYHTVSYQAGQGKYLRIYKAAVTEIRSAEGFALPRKLHHYRQTVTVKIQNALPPEEAALLCAMIFGDRSGMDDSTRDLLNAAGIGHIAVVSGLHLVFFCTVLMWLFRRLRLSARVSFLLLIPTIGVYILLVDASVSVFRAAVMVLLSTSAGLFGRRGDTLRSLCIAMFLCTVFTPYVIGSASFWLTVSGVFGIGILAPYLTEKLDCRAKMRTFLSLCCVTLTVFPASVLLCGETSLLGPITNLLVLPVCIFALYLGFSMLLTGGLTAFLLPLAGMLCRFARVAAMWLVHLPYSHITITETPVRAALFLLTLLLLLLLIQQPKPERFAAAMMSAAVVLTVLSTGMQLQNARALRIAVLGGKKQAALVISADGSTVIADLTGSPRNAQYVQRYLEQNGISRADVLVLSGGKAAAGYQSALGTVGAALLCNAESWRGEVTLCGVRPQFAAENVHIRCGNAEISLDHGTVRIQWNGMTAAVLPADDAEQPQCAAVIRYGTAEPEATLCGVDCTEYGSALLLRLTKDGCGDIRNLAQGANTIGTG